MTEALQPGPRVSDNVCWCPRCSRTVPHKEHRFDAWDDWHSVCGADLTWISKKEVLRLGGKIEEDRR